MFCSLQYIQTPLAGRWVILLSVYCMLLAFLVVFLWQTLNLRAFVYCILLAFCILYFVGLLYIVFCWAFLCCIFMGFCTFYFVGLLCIVFCWLFVYCILLGFFILYFVRLFSSLLRQTHNLVYFALVPSTLVAGH